MNPASGHTTGNTEENGRSLVSNRFGPGLTAVPLRGRQKSHRSYKILEEHGANATCAPDAHFFRIAERRLVRQRATFPPIGSRHAPDESPAWRP